MSYSDLLNNESATSRYLAILKPKRKAGAWTLFSGSVYSQAFDYGRVSVVTSEGSGLAEGTSTALSAGQFFFDQNTNILYVRLSDSSNPNAKFVVVTYELYFVSDGEAKYWYRNPTDDSSETVFFDNKIVTSPKLKQTTSEVIYGVIPTASSSLTLQNAEHIFEKHVYDGSFYNASIQMFHVLYLENENSEPFDTDNIRLVYDGLCLEYDYSGGTISIKTTDRINTFNSEFRNTNQSFFSLATFSELDPNAVGKPIRYVYGVVDGYPPTNIDYKSDSPGTSDNRVWVAIAEQVNLNEISRLVSVSPSSTATRTYVSDASGYLVGDSIWLDRASGTDEYKIVTLVNYVSNYVEHSALSGGAMTAGDQIKRSFVGNVTIIQNGVKYQALYGRDYLTSPALAGGTAGFTFSTSLESNISLPSTLSPNDKISIRVYGRKNDVTLGGPSFGGNDEETDNITSPVVVLLDLLKRSGLQDNQIDSAQFTSLEGSNTEAIGFAIPSSSGGSFPTYKAIIVEILKTSLIRLFVNNSNEWSISRLEPITGSASKVVTDDEMRQESFTYDFDFSDTASDFTVKYAKREIADDLAITGESTSQVTATSNVAKFQHGLSKIFTHDSLHFRSADAQTLCNRLSYYLGDRIGKVRIQSHKRFFDVLLNDKIEIERTQLPGFVFDEETLRTRKFAVTDFEKDLSLITIKLDDQRGVQENAGAW